MNMKPRSDVQRSAARTTCEHYFRCVRCGWEVESMDGSTTWIIVERHRRGDCDESASVRAAISPRFACGACGRNYATSRGLTCHQGQRGSCPGPRSSAVESFGQKPPVVRHNAHCADAVTSRDIIVLSSTSPSPPFPSVSPSISSDEPLPLKQATGHHAFCIDLVDDDHGPEIVPGASSNRIFATAMSRPDATYVASDASTTARIAPAPIPIAETSRLSTAHELPCVDSASLDTPRELSFADSSIVDTSRGLPFVDSLNAETSHELPFVDTSRVGTSRQRPLRLQLHGGELRAARVRIFRDESPNDSPPRKRCRRSM